MDSTKKVKDEIQSLVDQQEQLLELCKNIEKTIEFGTAYQSWYSRSIKVIEALGPERLTEFVAIYEIDPKRKSYDARTYSIQDYVQGYGASSDRYKKPAWDVHIGVHLRILNQAQILISIGSRVDAVIADIQGSLLADLQDSELATAVTVSKISDRAAGAIAGVVLERHLGRIAAGHGVKIRKKTPTVSDLNDPLKKASVYDTPTWRKIQHLGDLRNLCVHQKEREPTDTEVQELISGVSGIIKTVF